ncbi:MAG: hypothetical protein CSB15_00595 [Clostridiales bacterium]|nr:MAG: hypothetical protein CSB15_00595 [Clostridiales bacterium]
MGILESNILKFIENTENDRTINLKSFMMIKDGNTLFRFSKKPYKFEDKQLLFSVTKSITSIGIGIASDKGYLNLDDKVLKYLDNSNLYSFSSGVDKVRIKDLLTMSSGLKDDKLFEILYKKDWVKEFLNLDFVEKVGTHYYYSTLGSHMLSVILKKATDVDLADFIYENLFKPLNINNFEWGKSPDGYSLGGMGLSLSIEDMSKIGVMLLNKGIYNGKRILSEKYVNNATSTNIVKQDDKKQLKHSFSGDGYGYQIHIGKNGYYRLDGAFGQICLVVPDKNIVISATSTLTRVENLLKYIYENLLSEDNFLNKSHFINIQNVLDDKIKTLHYDLPEFFDIPKGFKKFNNATYKLDENVNLVDKITLNSTDNGLDFKVKLTDVTNYLSSFSFDKPIESSGVFMKDSFYEEQKYMSFAKWISPNELKLFIYYLETPYIMKYKLKFEEDRVDIRFFINCSFTIKNIEVLGKLVK